MCLYNMYIMYMYSMCAWQNGKTYEHFARQFVMVITQPGKSSTASAVQQVSQVKERAKIH